MSIGKHSLFRYLGFALRWALPFLAAFLPIVLLSVYSYKIAADSVSTLVESTNISGAANVGQQVHSDLSHMFNIATAVTSLDTTRSAVQEQDAKAVRTFLKPVVLSSSAISRGFVVSTGGTLWSDYPPAPNAVGQDFSESQWYQTFLQEEKPLISPIYIRTEEPKQPVSSIIAPIKNEEEKLIGTLVLEYRLSDIRKALQNIKLAETGFLFLLDHKGMLIAHPERSNQTELYSGFAKLPGVMTAMNGKIITKQYTDPLQKRHMLATFMPIAVGNESWVVVAAQPTDEAYAPLVKVQGRIALAGGVLTLLTVLMIVTLAKTRARNERLNRELQEKNQLLREVASIVESSNDAIIGLSLEGTVKTWNAAAAALLGYKETDMVDKKLTAITKKQQPKTADILKQMKKGKAVKQMETEWMTKDGDIIPVSLTFSPVKNEQGNTAGVSLIAQDITARKRVEQMKSNFIAFVSHQLRSPVTTISWHTEILLEWAEKEGIPKEYHELLTEIHEINKKDERLISDLLNVSRINRGVIKAEMSNASLQEIIEMAVRTYRQPIKEQGLELILQNMEKDITVYADAEKMAEAISNSVSNAIKHTEKGSITISMRTEGNEAFVDVTDTGGGIPEEIIKKLFSSDQILGSSASSEKSAGLGLFIAKNFMTLQKGDVTVSSTPGEGTTFTYRIPLSKT